MPALRPFDFTDLFGTTADLLISSTTPAGRHTRRGTSGRGFIELEKQGRARILK